MIHLRVVESFKIEFAMSFFYITNIALARSLFLIMGVDNCRTNARQARKMDENRGQEQDKGLFYPDFFQNLLMGTFDGEIFFRNY